MKDTAKTILDRVREFERGYIVESDTDPLHKIREADRAAYVKARDATKALLDATNTMGAEKAVQAGVVAGILETHRYLQSQGIVAILTALGEFGRLDGQSDARNEHAKETCRLLLTVLRERIYWPER